MATGGGSVATCKLSWCSKPRYREPSGFVHDFCGRTHAELYRNTHGHYGLSSNPQRSTLGSSRKHPTPSSRQQPLKALHSFSLSSSTSFVGSSSSRGEIRFYNRDEPYYEFTNFYPASIMVDGKSWPTSEHYFQAQKFVGTPYVDVIRNLKAPREAFQMSRDTKVSRWRRKDWESIKDDIMLKALLCKFTQHKRLQKKLLETGSKKLVEHTFNDSYWGDGGDGSGGNKLGQLLMQVRKKLEAVYGIPVTTPPLAKQTESPSGFHGGSSSQRMKRSVSFSDLRTLNSKPRMDTASDYHTQNAVSDIQYPFTTSPVRNRTGSVSRTRDSTPRIRGSSRTTAYSVPPKQHTKGSSSFQYMPSKPGVARTTAIHGTSMTKKDLQPSPRPLPPDPCRSSLSSRDRPNRANAPSNNRSPITGAEWYMYP